LNCASIIYAQIYFVAIMANGKPVEMLSRVRSCLTAL